MKMTVERSPKLDQLFPPEISEEETDKILDRSNYIERTALIVGGAAVFSAAAIEVFKKFRYSPGLVDDE